MPLLHSDSRKRFFFLLTLVAILATVRSSSSIDFSTAYATVEEYVLDHVEQIDLVYRIPPHHSPTITYGAHNDTVTSHFDSDTIAPWMRSFSINSTSFPNTHTLKVPADAPTLEVQSSVTPDSTSDLPVCVAAALLISPLAEGSNDVKMCFSPQSLTFLHHCCPSLSLASNSTCISRHITPHCGLARGTFPPSPHPSHKSPSHSLHPVPLSRSVHHAFPSEALPRSAFSHIIHGAAINANVTAPENQDNVDISALRVRVSPRDKSIVLHYQRSHTPVSASSPTPPLSTESTLPPCSCRVSRRLIGQGYSRELITTARCPARCISTLYPTSTSASPPNTPSILTPSPSLTLIPCLLSQHIWLPQAIYADPYALRGPDALLGQESHSQGTVDVEAAWPGASGQLLVITKGVEIGLEGGEEEEVEMSISTRISLRYGPPSYADDEQRDVYYIPESPLQLRCGDSRHDMETEPLPLVFAPTGDLRVSVPLGNANEALSVVVATIVILGIAVLSAVYVAVSAALRQHDEAKEKPE